jgi:hypothetical protein
VPQVPRPVELVPPSRSPCEGQVPPSGVASAAKKAGPVTVTLPLVAVLVAAVFVAYRYMNLKIWQVVLCLLFGFLLAATTAAPGIREALITVINWFRR